MRQTPSTIKSYLGRRVLFVALGVVLVTGMAWLLQIYLGHEALSRHLHDDAVARSCVQLESQVHQALVFAKQQEMQVKQRVRENIRQRVETACESVGSFTQQNKGRLSEEELQNQVREFLRAMSLQDANNYIFAVSQEGVVELQPTQRWLEGKGIADLDSTNARVIRELLEITRNGAARYHEYSWFRPGLSDTVYGKLSYVKVCPCIGWVVGCGEYLQDIREEVQERTLDWMSAIRFGESGYLFAGTWNGISLLGPAKGTNIMDTRDLTGRAVVQELIQRSMADGDTLQYTLPPVGDYPSRSKLSFVKGIKDWEWYIGAGAYLDEIDALANEEHRHRHSAMLDALLVILATLLVTGSLAGVVVQRFGARIAGDIAVFNRFFRQATEHSESIRVQDLRLQDLRDTAELANASIRRRHNAERALRSSEEYNRLLIEHAPDAFFAIDEQGRFTEVNEQACLSLGYSREELLGMRVWEVEVHSSVELDLELFFEELLQVGHMTAAGVHRRKDGSVFPVETSIAPFEVGDTRQIYGFARNVSERSEAEANLRRSEERFRSVIQSIPMGVHLYRIDENGVLILEGANPAADGILGITHDDFIGSSLEDVFPDLRGTPTIKEYYRIASEGGTYYIKSREYHDERIVGGIFEVTVFQTQPGHIAVFFLDISERFRQEREIRLSEQRLREILDTIGAGVYTIDPDTRRVTYINPAAAQLLGLSRDEAVGRPCRGFLCDASMSDCGLTHPELIGKSLERELIRPDGSRVSVMKSISRAVVGGKEVLLESFIDLSSLRKAEEEKANLEEQLRQAQKMEAIGQLAGGVAHDFNNLLQVINGYTLLALEDLPAEHEVTESLQEVSRAGERAARLVEQLLAFSRRQIMQPQNLDLNTVVEDLSSMLRRLIGEHIELQVQQTPELWQIHADRGMLEQVLMNLVLNARDAMPDGGELVIRTDNAELDAAIAREQTWAREGRYVRLSVQDSGQGMSQSVLDRMFEPFFTTKETGRGTGLGLATVYGIVSQHGGLIHVESTVAKGSRFNIYLPVAEALVESLDEEEQVTISGGSETILLAEDDDLVRSLAEQILSRKGYTVLSAKDGREAVELFEREGEHVHLLLLDVVMPQLSGREVLEKIHAMRPGVPALFASGYSESAIHTDFILHEGIRLVQKPYHHSELLRAVRDTLDNA